MSDRATFLDDLAAQGVPVRVPQPADRIDPVVVRVTPPSRQLTRRWPAPPLPKA